MVGVYWLIRCWWSQLPNSNDPIRNINVRTLLELRKTRILGLLVFSLSNHYDLVFILFSDPDQSGVLHCWNEISRMNHAQSNHLCFWDSMSREILRPHMSISVSVRYNSNTTAWGGDTPSRWTKRRHDPLRWTNSPGIAKHSTISSMLLHPVHSLITVREIQDMLLDFRGRSWRIYCCNWYRCWNW